MKAIFAALVSIFSLTACEDLTFLTPVDGEPCLEDFEGNLYLGEEAQKRTCHVGEIFHKKNSMGGWDYFCVGSAPPTPEQCEDGGQDLDCFGGPDNVAPIQPFEDGNFCYTTEQGICKLSTTECIGSQWVCVPPPTYGVEICNDPGVGRLLDWLYDDSCDGLTDNDDPNLVLSGPEFQYNGPEGTLNVGLCRAGHLECIDGQEILRGEVLPTDEICSVPGAPPQDENCNGETDELRQEAQPEAIMLMVDTSGSMTEEIEASLETFCSTNAASLFPNSRASIYLVGLYLFGGAYISEPFIVKLTDFVPLPEACDELRDWYVQEGLNGGAEHFPEAVVRANQIGGPLFSQWPSGFRRRTIIFTDEEPQPYLISNDEALQQVRDTCAYLQFSLNVFTSSTYDYLWLPYTNACAGWTEQLTQSPSEMRSRMTERLGAECVSE